MWFRRRRRAFTPFDYSALPEPATASLDEAADEGVMLAEFAGRMAIKNQILVGTLTEPGPYDAARYAEAARAVLYELMQESDESATRIAGQRATAELRAGIARDHHDYRADDAENLRRRERMFADVAERLWRLRGDDAYVDRFVERAREDAWGEIAAEIEAALDRIATPVVLDDDERSRAKRIRQLQKDLARLVRDHAN
ncbi:hypothetical protein [Luethyella okanaganae]|uniref:Asparagine synthase n=1 Tax=Luethyella okanaganae TaxID=69372 RepID=A0ABW1VD50_9MICO